jgi:hypothetical protein
MDERDKEWPAVGRIAWLNGGLVAINEPGKTVKIEAGIGGPILFSYQLSSFGSFFSTLVAQGFSVIGGTYITDVEESQGIRAPEFRAYFAKQPKWRAFEIHQHWGQVAHAASQRDKMAIMDIASRIATELSYCESRLQGLAEAYAIQLGGKGRKGSLDEEGGFQDSHSQRVYMSIHAMFWELAVLRDYFAEFAAQFVFGIEKVTKFAKLVPALAGKDLDSDELAKMLLEAGSSTPPGWLTVFSKYRNLFTHSAPMEKVANVAFAQLTQISLPDGRKVPEIYYPLPSDVMELAKRRAAGWRHKSFEEFIGDSIHRNQNLHREAEPDALSYLHAVFEKMVVIAEMLILRSPLEPEMIHLTEKDIVGEVKVYRGGELVFQGNVNSSRGDAS